MQNAFDLSSEPFCFNAGKSGASNELGYLSRDSVPGTTSVPGLYFCDPVLRTGDTVCQSFQNQLLRA